jgi:lysophospholipase L1-like esterase
MKIIACTGDSHTWGQGGANVLNTFGTWSSPVVAGEHRMLPFFTGAYVNLLRGYVNARTGSSAAEYEAPVLCRAFGLDADENCASADGLRLPFDGELLRLQFRYTAQSVRAEVRVDGKLLWEDDLFREERGNPYNLVTLMLSDGPHLLEIAGKAVPLYRVEIYRGPWAVVNCGVGSCPVGRFMTEYYDKLVAPLRPVAVLAEGHTINDWIQDRNAGECEEATRAFFRKIRADGADPWLLSVEPILGDLQFPPNTNHFTDFIEAGFRAAALENVPVIDAYAALSERLNALEDEEARFKAWFEDNWHPNAAGHALYADLSYDALRAYFD